MEDKVKEAIRRGVQSWFGQYSHIPTHETVKDITHHITEYYEGRVPEWEFQYEDKATRNKRWFFTVLKVAVVVFLVWL